MYKVNIFIIGKLKTSFLEEAIEEYIKRLQPHLSITWHRAKDEEQLLQQLQKQSFFIALDPHGKTLTSEQFASWLQESFIQGGSRLCFVIGSAEGLSQQIKDKARALLSLSSLTFPHELARLILLEQLYRAMEIQKGSPYHK